ncbi:MAG: hypothetical protein EAZ19_15045 [Oscillatoriales cyanobacterium]|nr:MAG: hypothetical protein EAZ19_15045 [Oscillatoriales cyanobacterium]
MLPMSSHYVNCQLSSQLSTVNCQLSTVNCQLSTVNCQLSTVNCQLSTANLFFTNKQISFHTPFTFNFNSSAPFQQIFVFQ